MIYRTSINTEYSISPECDVEVEIEVEARLSGDGDGGLDVEIVHAWTDGDTQGGKAFVLDEDLIEGLALVDLVLDEAWNAAYCVGRLPLGNYKNPEGKQVEVLGICSLPGRFEWVAVCRKPATLNCALFPKKNDDGGLLLIPTHQFASCYPVQPMEDEALAALVKEERLWVKA